MHAKKDPQHTAGMAPKSPEQSITHMTEIVLPQHTNALGTIFGGVLMSWIDIAAAIAAGRHAGRTCVTASIDQLHFLKPILKTHIVNIEARITSVHNTSCEVMVTVEGESAADGTKFHTAQAFLTFVALGEDGRPTPMPPLKVTTNEEKTLQKHAELRRQHRISLKRALEK